MAQRIVLAVDADITGGLDAARRCARQLSYELQEPVLVVDVTGAQLDVIRATALREEGLVSEQELVAGLRSQAPSAAPMAPAPFVWRDDGRPDWGNMWQSFCELALFGGPPHRGEDQPLRAANEADVSPSRADDDAIAEIQRGIRETTGLESELAELGWLAVYCDSPKMAAWLCATILLENVEARCIDTRLLVPAAPDFELKDQVKSIITVLAKTHHYWQAHLAATTTA